MVERNIYGVDKNKGFYFLSSHIDGVIDKKCPTSFVVVRFKERFGKSFADYYAHLTEINACFNEKRFTVSETRASSRVLNSWSKEKVLPLGVRHRANWKKFSAIELVWIDAVHKMREFGMSLKDIATVREWVMQWDKKNKSYPWFEYYFNLAYLTSDDPYIVIFPHGVAELATSTEIEIAKAMSKDNQHMLLISLKEILRNGMGFDIPRAAPLREVTGKEHDVLQQIRGTKTKEVKVRTRDGSISEIETTEIFPESKWAKLNDMRKQLEESGTYGEILTHFSGGKQQSSEVRRVKRFKQPAIGQQAGAITK